MKIKKILPICLIAVIILSLVFIPLSSYWMYLGTINPENIINEVEKSDEDSNSDNESNKETESDFGNPTQIILNKNCDLNIGLKLKNVKLDLSVKNQQGNTRKYSTNEYNLLAEDKTIEYGGSYSVTVQDKSNNNLKLIIPVNVINKLEAEDAQIVGISDTGLKDNTYLAENNSYYYNSSDKNKLISTGEKVVCASYFNVNANENSITFKFNSLIATNVNLKFRMGNPYPVQNSDKSKEMHEYQINKNLQLYVNNNKVTISDDKKIEGFGHYPYVKNNTDWVRLFYVFFDVVIENVNLVSGENTIKINFSKYVPSEDGLPSRYGDSGIIRGINFDYILLQKNN